VGSFWWRDVLKNLHTYKELTHVDIKDGRTTLLWFAQLDGTPKSEEYPKLLSHAINKDISIKQARMNNLQEMFHTPITEEAFQQLHSLNASLSEQHSNDQCDKWIYAGGSHLYSSQRAYKHMVGESWTDPVYSWMWRSKCQPKQKVFF
jgi:nickel-dependent lactate racemase